MKKNRQTKGYWERTRTFRDLAVIAITAIFIFAVTSAFDLFEILVGWTQRHKKWQVDELLMVIVILTFSFTVFSIRRWRELRREIAKRDQIDEALQTERQRLQMLSENVPFGMAMIDKRGVFGYVNPKFRELFGYDLKDIPDGKSWFRKAYPDAIYRHHVISTWLSDLESYRPGEKRLRVFTVTCRDGTEKIVEFIPVQLENGENLMTCEDITDQMRTEEDFRNSEEKYRSLVESTEDSIYMVDRDGRYLFANERQLSRLGLPQDQVIGREYGEFHTPEEGREFTQKVNEVLTTAHSLEYEHRSHRDNRYFIRTLSPVRSHETGEVKSVTVISKEITGRKQIEEELGTEKQRFQTLTENAPFGMMLVDQQGGFRYINPKFRELFGYDLEDVLDGKTWFRKAYPDSTYRHHVISTWLNDLERSKPGEKRPRVFTATCKNGGRKIINFISVQLEAGEELVACEDITDRMHAEESLKEGERFLASIFASIQDGLAILDNSLHIVRTNPTLERWYSYAMPLVGRKCYEAFQGRKDPCSICPTRKTIESGGAAYEVVPKIGPSGETAGWLDLYSFPLIDPTTGKMKGVIEYVRDITERKQAEEAQRRSEESAQQLAKEKAIVADIGRIVSSTLNIEEVYDRFAEEVRKLISFDRLAINIISFKENAISVAYATGIEVPDRLPGEVVPLAGSAIEALVRTRSGLLVQAEKIESLGIQYPSLVSTFQAGLRSMMSVPLISKDQVIGTLNFRSTKTNAYTDLDLKLAESIGTQIAGAIANAQLFIERSRAEEEKRALEEQFRQSQKMEAIGRLAGGIAHDFNNLMTIISGYSQLSLSEIKGDHPLRDNIMEIQRATERAAALTHQLLAFSRRQILDMKLLDLNSVLRDLDKMLRRLIGEDIELATLLADDLWRIKTDPGQIEQMILNLAVNARDAMPGGGKLTIETENVYLDEAYTRSHTSVKPGDYVRLSVSDTGVGMSAEVKEWIFEPFFTTKEKGKGTGLGLSTVYGIVKQSEGNIWVYSELGHGTTFKIYLPRADEAVPAFKPKPALTVLPQGSETILLVEDEEAVRALARKALQSYGYNILEAANGEEALHRMEEHQGERVHLLLADVVMPGMGGRELAERLRPLYPEMKVLYISGYTDTAIVHHGILEPGTKFLQKPFTPIALALKMREVLDE